jgi:hypothetical protein
MMSVLAKTASTVLRQITRHEMNVSRGNARVTA